MSTLFINACARSDSRTHELAGHVLRKLTGLAEEIDLFKTPVSPMTAETLAKREALLKSGQLNAPMFDFARRFAGADTIVIAAPFWDLSFPSVLKTYIENICVAGITFKYVDGRPVGLCRAKRLIYVTTSGGPFFPEFGFGYIKALAQNFFGIPAVDCVSVENLDIIGTDVRGILQNAHDRIDEMTFED